MRRLLIPGKTFILGEYAILDGSPALLLGHGPRFAATFTPGSAKHPFHGESPAGKWLAAHPYAGKISFTDPHRGLGGFGGSGAEFVAAYAAGFPRVDPWEAWDASRAFPGSGADILTQAYGLEKDGDFFLGVDIARRELTALPSGLGVTLSLFHTGRKLATHEHLRAKPELPVEEMRRLVSAGGLALAQRDSAAFAAAVHSYRNLLVSLGLEAAHTCAALGQIPREKVLAAKGCGAMGSDVILVVHEGAALDLWARENSLAPLGNYPV